MTDVFDRDADKLVDIRRYQPEPLFDPWGECVVPNFPIDTLPPIVACYVETQAVLIGCDPAGLAMACLAALGAALDHSFKLRLMRHSSWSASPRLWVLLSGEPSRKKTPTVDAAVRDLEFAQGQAFDAWQKACAEHEATGGAENDQPERPPRYVATDTTVEKLGEILARQSRGILVKRDELSGWIGSMDAYKARGGAAADRAFWLQAYDGGSYAIDRVNRGERLVANLSVSIIGGIQPAKLAEMRDQTPDGLLQRFVPIILKPARLPVDAPSGDAGPAYGRLIRRLLELEPATLILDDAALVEMKALQSHLFDIEQASAGMATGFQTFIGKLPGMAASIALILHLAGDTVHGRTTPVGLQTVLSVRRIVEEFVLPHALEFYRGADTVTDGDRLQKIASYILTSGKAEIRMSDLTTNVALCRGATLARVNEMVSPLVAAEWLTPKDAGAVTRTWKVEPRVAKQFAQRRRDEERRKDAMASLMKSPRKAKTGGEQP